MQEQVQIVVEALKGSWRFRWRALLVAWCIAVAGFGTVLFMPDRFEAKARVFIDTESVLKPLLSGLAVATDVLPQVNMMTQALVSRPQLETAARATDLHLRARTPEQFESLIEQLRTRIRISAGRGDNIYTIQFADTDPQMAQRVVQTILNSFVENTLGANRVDSTKAQEFLDQEIRNYERRLTEAEDRLADFKRKHVGMMPGAQGDYFGRLQTATAELERVRGALAVARDRRDAVRRQLDGESPSFGIVSPSGTFRAMTGDSMIDGQIAELERRLSELSVQFTDKHPDIIAIREKIAYLQNRKDTERATAPPTSVEQNQPLDLNPVYQSLQIDLGKAEVEVRTLEAQLNEQQRLVGNLRSRVDTIPEVEAQLVQLNRDYDVTRTQYEALLGRLESARLTEEAEQNRDDIRFRVIDPPFVPSKPLGPPRQLLLAAALVLALVGGAAFAIIAQQIQPVFSSRRQLRTVAGLPVLGTISNAPGAAAFAAERRELLQLAAATAGLLVSFGVSLLLAEHGARLIRSLPLPEIQ